MNGGTAIFTYLVNVEIFLILGQADPSNQIHSQRDHTRRYRLPPERLSIKICIEMADEACTNSCRTYQAFSGRNVSNR